MAHRLSLLSSLISFASVELQLLPLSSMCGQYLMGHMLIEYSRRLVELVIKPVWGRNGSEINLVNFARANPHDYVAVESQQSYIAYKSWGNLRVAALAFGVSVGSNIVTAVSSGPDNKLLKSINVAPFHIEAVRNASCIGAIFNRKRSNSPLPRDEVYVNARNGGISYRTMMLLPKSDAYPASPSKSKLSGTSISL